MNTVCVIGARGGSKGLPGKNLRPLLGKPLIAWSIEQAKACPEISRVVVSTDSEAIADVARDYGADIPFLRPDILASDTAGKWNVWQHALEACERHYGAPVDIYVDLDCTSPLREVDDISRAIAQFVSAGVDAVFSVCEARKNPYFNMVELTEDGCAQLVKSPPTPVHGRQFAPKVYAMNASIYVWHRRTLSKGLWSGRARLYVMPRERSIDIDAPLDFLLVEMLMREKHGIA